MSYSAKLGLVKYWCMCVELHVKYKVPIQTHLGSDPESTKCCERALRTACYCKSFIASPDSLLAQVQPLLTLGQSHIPTWKCSIWLRNVTCLFILIHYIYPLNNQ